MGLTTALEEYYRALQAGAEATVRYVEKVAEKTDPNRGSNAAEAQSKARDAMIVGELKHAVRRMLLQNYMAAGFKQDTGRLRSAVSNAEVWIARTGGKVRIMVGFAKGMVGTKTASKAREKSPYVYGGAQNSGAVRQPLHIRPIISSVKGSTIPSVRYGKAGALGAGAKRSLKKAVFKHNAGKRALGYLAKKKVDPYDSKDTGKSFRVGKQIIVIKPRNFFKLTPAQIVGVQKLYSKLLSEVSAKSKQGSAA